MRIAFLFNHDQVHQVAHSLPIALELAAASPDAEIIHAATYRAEQRRLFAASFDLTAEPSSRRAARVVAGLAGLSLPETVPAAAYA